MRVNPGPAANRCALATFHGGHHGRLADVRIRAARSGGLPSFGLTSLGLHSILRAVGQHQLQDLHVGRGGGAVKRRAVDRRAAAQRRRVQRADERLVHVRAEVEQRLHQTQGGQIVRMVGLQPRAVVRAHVGGGVVHVDGEEQGSVVGIGAEVEQFLGQIEAVVDDSDDGRARAIGVGQLQIGAALDQRLDNILRVRCERRTSVP